MPTRAKIQDKRITDVLQQSVNTELTVSQHYWGRAAYWRGRGMKRLTEMYEKEANEERGHAQLSADRMVFLGTDPELVPQMEKAPSTKSSLKQHFTEDLTGEVTVANQYTEWVQKAMDLQDFVTFEIFRKILRETEEHVDFLQMEQDIPGSFLEKH